MRRRQRELERPFALGAYPDLVHGELAAAADVLGVTCAEFEAAAESTWRPDRSERRPMEQLNPREWLELLIGAAVRLERPSIMVETGVAHGFSSAIALRAMEDIGRGRLVSIDLPPLEIDDDSIGAIVPAGLRHRWRLELGPSRALLPKLLEEEGPIDIFFHDADHTYSSQMEEYRTAWPHLRPGGLLLSDDVINPAFVEFGQSVGSPPMALLATGAEPPNAIGIMRKP